MTTEKILLVIDMQKDFVTGSLANKEAEKIINKIEEKIEQYVEQGNHVFFTRDTHGTDYMNTQEGRLLPVEHCIKGSEGWEIVESLAKYAQDENIFDKRSFGAVELPDWLRKKLGKIPSEIEICGVCTDICVISNAIILKAAFPETPLSVISDLCAGVTPQSHRTALEAMKACQIDVGDM